MPVTGTTEIGALYAIRMSPANAAILSGLGIASMFTTTVSGEPHFIITEENFSTLQRGPHTLRGGRSDVEGITVVLIGIAREAADDRDEDEEDGGETTNDAQPDVQPAGTVYLDEVAAPPTAGGADIDRWYEAQMPTTTTIESVNAAATQMVVNGVHVVIPHEERTNWGHGDGSGNHDHRKAFMRIAARIGAHTGKPVSLRCPHSTQGDPFDLGDFTIWLYSSPITGPEVDNNLTAGAWGIPVLCTDSPSVLRGLDRLVMAPEGSCLGTLDQANLFIYHDICHRGRPDEIALFDRIITEAIALIPKEQDMARLTKDEIKARFVTLCAGRIDRQLADAKATAASADALITESSRRIADAVRSKNDAAHLESTLTARKGAESETLGKEFDNLGRIKKLERVSFRGDKLVMTLDTMRVTDPRTQKRHEVGKMEVTMDPARGEIMFKNKTRLVHGMEQKMHAPHIFNTGRPCLGSLSQALPKLISGYEFAVAIQMIIAFLESVNVDDGAGRHVDRWPLIGEDGKFIPNTYSTELAPAEVPEGAIAELQPGQRWLTRNGLHSQEIRSDGITGTTRRHPGGGDAGSIPYNPDPVMVDGAPAYRYAAFSSPDHACWDLVKLLSGPGFVEETAPIAVAATTAVPNTLTFAVGQVWRSEANSYLEVTNVSRNIATGRLYRDRASWEQQGYFAMSEYEPSGVSMMRGNSPLVELIRPAPGAEIAAVPAATPRRRRARTAAATANVNVTPDTAAEEMF